MLTSQQLYDNLRSLIGEPDSSFYVKDFTKDSKVYSIFNYRLASYTDFCKPDALEARGIMFEMSSGEPILVCRPPKKFFNLNENPFTMNMDHSRLICAMTKADGSLISTYLHCGKLALKSKGSLDSEQVHMAEAWLVSGTSCEFLNYLDDVTRKGWTVNMELVSPLNRIVLPYEKTELKVLNIRNLQTGEMLCPGMVRTEGLQRISLGDYVNRKYFVDYILFKDNEEQSAEEGAKEFVEEIPDTTGIEGFVLIYEDGQLVKHKTTWYLALHHTKDSITIPRRLFECIINEATDDLRAMFSTDQVAIDMIIDMENKVIPKYNSIVKSVDNFYETNKTLSRKDYAILGTKTMGDLFGLCMGKYLEANGLSTKKINMKEWAIKNYKMFGIKEELESVIDG